jgi:hypothetical protein
MTQLKQEPKLLLVLEVPMRLWEKISSWKEQILEKFQKFYFPTKQLSRVILKNKSLKVTTSLAQA